MRSAAQQVCHQRRGVVDLLEIVQHQQERLVPEVLGQPLDGGRARVHQAHGLGNRGQQELRAGDWLQGNEIDTVREPVAGLRGHLEGEARLARPAGPGHGDQPIRVDERSHLVHFALAAEE